MRCRGKRSSGEASSSMPAILAQPPVPRPPDIALDPDATSGCALVVVREEGSVNVGEVAELAGVTVRTLHHYDRIGLLSPSGRTAAGYRRYSAADLDPLDQVLL